MKNYGRYDWGRGGTARVRAAARFVLFIGSTLILLSTAACQPISSEEALANLVATQEEVGTVADTGTPAVATVGAEGAVRAEEITLDDGTTITYTVVLPPNYVTGSAYPTLLTLPPGSQTESMVDAGLAYWRAGAMTNGWVVVSPVAPNGQLFFRGSEVYIPEFLMRIAPQYPPEGEKFHLSGISNGGISAFRVAGLHPEWFHSLIAMPGFPQSPEDKTNLERLTTLPIALFVGGNDMGWIDPMRAAVTTLNQQGGNATLEIIADEGHVIGSLTGGDVLFALLEEFRGSQ